MARNKNINKIIGDGFVELQKEVIALRTERDALQAWKDEAEKQEPVAAVRIWDEFSINTFEFEQYAGFRNLPVGEYKLYLNPAPAKEGYVLAGYFMLHNGIPTKIADEYVGKGLDDGVDEFPLYRKEK